jgi:hypothetical protein
MKRAGVFHAANQLSSTRVESASGEFVTIDDIAQRFD